MKTIAISCNHCGAGLNPPDDARFITCSFCGTRLQVCHEGNAYFSRVMEAIAQDTAKMSGDLDDIKIQNEIERLDREWALERERYLTRNKDGSTSAPAGSVVYVLMAMFWLAFGTFLTVKFADAPASGIWLVPAGITMLGTLGILSQVGSREKFQTAPQDYLRRRVILLEKLPKDLIAK